MVSSGLVAYRPIFDRDVRAVGVLEDLTTVRAEEFVLTERASDLQHGYGWFRLSSPLDGWAYSK